MQQVDPRALLNPDVEVRIGTIGCVISASFRYGMTKAREMVFTRLPEGLPARSWLDEVRDEASEM